MSLAMSLEGGPDSLMTVKLSDNITITGKKQAASEAYPKSLDLFFGIRYATAGRYESPLIEKLSSAKGNIDATHHSPTCPVPMAPQETSEDCLRLNIFRPSVEGPQRNEGETKKLPVVVHFHGGGFNFGNPLDNDLPSFVARSGKGVLAVSVGYRLGALGFGPTNGHVNLGLKDQRVAIEWVRENIGVFGGDGEDITLMGVSAGAHSIGHHMLNPGKLSFGKAIIESGSPTARSVLSHSHPRTQAQYASYKKHLPTTSPSSHTVDAILHASLMVWAEHMDSLAWPFQPVIDGDIIPDLPLNLWQSRTSNGVSSLPSIITGFCSHEGADFMPKRLPSFRQFWKTLIPSLDLDALEELYPDNQGDEDAAQRRRLSEAYGHYAYICPVIHTAHMASKAGGRVYLYEYAGFNGGEGDFKTAGHCAQASLVRPQIDEIGGNPGQMNISREMNRRWTDFVASPAGELAEEEWPVFDTPFTHDSASISGKGKMLVFGEGNDEAQGGCTHGTPVKTRVFTAREIQVCKFWWGVMELSQGMGEKGVAQESW